ncbi:alkaline phosphatase family protein [Akkermansiaceae bacterium]|nr:alkaline phosphatase family protein [Akkermansiaceae bacterium]MDB4681770.1 alkaline phosphatase family protein [Akkermansiaceae bacterium]
MTRTLLSFLGLASFTHAGIFLGQGTMSGEATDTSVFLQTRLTSAAELDASGDLPGASGVVAFEWSLTENFDTSSTTPFQKAEAAHDFIVRTQLSKLKSHTAYFYRAHYGTSEAEAQTGPTGTFKTLPGESSDAEVRFIIGSCMNYCKFMYGKKAKASGPVTATAEDKQLGFPAFVTMAAEKPDFFVGTGDIVYYDNPFRTAETITELRKCWHEQFRFPRMIDFFKDVPTYWSKDDHDFRYNDSDNTKDRLPLSTTGIDMFREQLPLPEKSYRTIRVSQDLQIWLTEGRDYRSPNKMPDGPEKTLWGAEQKAWLQSTLKASDAKWKLLISPTPLVGPDDAYKKDNHANLKGFRHEADAFFKWLAENKIENFMTFCGDRHWQYHSIHPRGINEFACGALNDENSRLGREPGDQKSTDPNALIKQPFISPKPSGGFLVLTAGKQLIIEFRDDSGKELYRVEK